MSVFTRLVVPAPTGRRAYSFFSSSGSRFFNSTRPPTTVSAAAGPNSNGGRGGVPKPGSASKQSTASSAKTSPASTTDAAKLAAEVDAPASAPSPTIATEAPAAYQPAFNDARVAFHPAPSAQDFRLHQFFSLHRPLLGLGQPGTAVFEAVPEAKLFAMPQTAETTASVEEVEESSIEADAHTARQLSHALVMNRVGSAIAFDATLRQLGLESGTDLQVYLDSTKRKRRSKMKKHKLRKRRKLQRATRLKLK